MPGDRPDPTAADAHIRHLRAEVEKIVGEASAGARVPAAVLALLAAGFSAGATFLRADVRQTANLRRRYAWQQLETRARLVLAHEAYVGVQELHAALIKLVELRDSVPSSALVLIEQQGPAQSLPAQQLPTAGPPDPGP